MGLLSLFIFILIVVLIYTYRTEILKILGGNDDFIEAVYKGNAIDGQKYIKEIQGHDLRDLPEGFRDDGEVILHVPGVVMVRDYVADATFDCPEMHNIGAGVTIKCLKDDKFLYYGCSICLRNKMDLDYVDPKDLARKLLDLHYPTHHGDFDWESAFDAAK
jgi:hypothetical protein